MMENKLLELGLKRRSCRQYGTEKIAADVIDEILKFALTAPSSFGHNPVSFVSVMDEDLIRKLGTCKARGGSQVNGASVVIVVVVDTANPGRAEFSVEDASVASAYILLAAEQFGAGACWVELRNRDGQSDTSDAEVRKLLGIPEGYTVYNMVAIGTKREEKKARTLEEMDISRIHKERY